MWQQYNTSNNVVFTYMDGPISIQISRSNENLPQKDYTFSCSMFGIINQTFSAFDDKSAKKISCDLAVSAAAELINILQLAKDRAV